VIGRDTSGSRRALARVALALGAGAVLAGSPYAAGRGRIDVQALARTSEREDDHVTAVELARWIRERRPAVRVVDVRTRKEFDEYHIPTAEWIPLDSLARARFDANETIVLYSEGGGHAAQAWVFLRALGYPRVFYLRSGLYEWLDDVMSPAVPAIPSPADSAVAALSRYFGGVPHVGERAATTVAKVRRRGC